MALEAPEVGQHYLEALNERWVPVACLEHSEPIPVIPMEAAQGLDHGVDEDENNHPEYAGVGYQPDCEYCINNAKALKDHIEQVAKAREIEL